MHVQKKLILSNLKEVYQLFKERFPTESIGFPNLLTASKALRFSWGKVVRMQYVSVQNPPEC